MTTPHQPHTPTFLKTVVPALLLATSVTVPAGAQQINKPAAPAIPATSPAKPIATPTTPAATPITTPPANNTPPEAPCGKLTQLGAQTAIYNKSRFDWDVVFTTYEYFMIAYHKANAGVVKYLSNGKWVDRGVGDYNHSKSYRIPVAAGKTVPIAYCADKSINKSIIQGKVEFVPTTAGYAGADIDDGVEFFGANRAPVFNLSSKTPYVDYDRNDSRKMEYGSITLCPNDAECKLP